MTTLFNRKVILQVGEKGGDGLEFSGLRIDFEVDKSRESNANTGKITIYNLSEDSRKFFEQKARKYILQAGYSGLNEDPLVGIISSGDIILSSTERRQTDRTTSITISEDGIKLAESYIEKSFEAGTQLSQIIDAIIVEMNVVKGAIIGLKNIVCNNGYSASGKAKDRLDEICGRQGLTWNVQNGRLQIYPREKDNGKYGYELSPDTGLLRAWRENVKVEGEKERKNVVKFESLLIPDLEVGRRIVINSDFGIEGEFIIKKLKFTGSNRDGDFKAIGEC